MTVFAYAKSVEQESSLRGSRYRRPQRSNQIALTDLMDFCGRKLPETQKSLFSESSNEDYTIYYAGNLSLLLKKCVSVIGARNVSEEGARRARKISAHLAHAGVVVTSGLAKGVDTAAHSGAIDNGGETVAVIGTPLDKCYPAENARIQERIWTNHLLISQFAFGVRTFPSDFPKRNKLMAAISDASIIVEASDTSGTLHQAAECVRLGRWLFIMKSVAEDSKLKWPSKFLENERVAVLSSIDDVLRRIES